MDPAHARDTSRSPEPYGTGQFGNVLSAYRELRHPTQVGPYTILELIGEGGMGSIYRAEQRTPIHRIVAVKVIKLGMDTREVIARFESERQALALMDHPNVAKVLDAGATETGRPYFVMEFVQGLPITAFADRHKLTIHRRLELFIQACDAIQHAHQKAIIHRDLKPSNILVTMVNDRPLVKVIDFGVAKAISHRLTERTLFTETGQLVGTPEYMAPEQAEGSALMESDTRSDVYSLGVILYELLTGALPFDPPTLRSAGYQEIQRIIREVDPPRPSTRLSGLGGERAQEVARLRQTQLEALGRQLKRELEWVPLKAMRKEPAHRYSSARELAEDIENYLASRPLRAAPESRAYRLRKFLRRNKTGVAASAAMVFLLLIGTAATTWQAVRATRAERRVRAALDQANQATARAGAINDFLLQDVLLASTPQITRGKPLTVVEALENASRTIAGRFRDSPPTRAAVLSTVASAHRELGRTAEAVTHARAALDLCERHLDPADRVTLSAMMELGMALKDQGNLSEAEPLLVEAMARARRHVGDQDELTITTMRTVGSLRIAQGRIDQAVSVSGEALDLARVHFGNQHEETLNSLNLMALALREQGKLAEAEVLLREAVQTSLALRGEDHPGTLNIMNSLSAVLQVRGELSEAVELKRRAVAGARRVLGDDHLLTIGFISNLADGLAHSGRVEEAMPLFREALERCRRVLGPDHHTTLGAANNFARVLTNHGHWEEARALYREAVERGRAARGIEHPDVLITVLNYARALASHGQLAEAEDLDREALAVARKHLGDDNRITMALMQELGDILRQADRLDEAEALVRESLERRQRVAGASDPDTLSSMRSLIDVLLAQGKLEAAEPIAADLYRRAGAADTNPRFVAQCMSQWGLCLHRMQRYADAEPPLREAFRRLTAAGVGPNNLSYRSVVTALADLCDRTNRPDEAATWRARLEPTPATRPATRMVS